MEDFSRNTAMWTVTLTDDDYLALSLSGNWPKFQRRVIDLLVRRLKAAGDCAVVIGVCEIGAERFARTGRPDPHIHLVTSGWGRREVDGQWLLRPDAMDDLVAKACQYAGLPSADRRSASNISRVKHSVASYMSKYLTKQMPVALGEVAQVHESLIPRQWWNQSAACKAMLDGAMCKLPPAFAAFLIRKQQLLERLELGRGGMATVGRRRGAIYDSPIEMFRFCFRSPECVQQAMELFALWAVNGEQLNDAELVMSG